MRWKKEHKESTQSYYGGCRKLGVESVPYHKFDMNEYNRIKQLKNNKPRKDEYR